MIYKMLTILRIAKIKGKSKMSPHIEWWLEPHERAEHTFEPDGDCEFDDLAMLPNVTTSLSDLFKNEE